MGARVYQPSLRLGVARPANEPERRAALVRLLRDADGGGIVYAATVRQIDLLFDLLRGLGFDVARDHRRMAPRQRKDTLARFMAGSLDAIIATPDFGSGLEMPQLGFVFHYSMPASPEAYYDETARAARDAAAVQCVLFAPIEGQRFPHETISGRPASDGEIRAVYEVLETLGGCGRALPAAEVKAAAATVDPAAVRGALALLKDVDVVKEQRGSQVRLVQRSLSPAMLAALADEHRARHTRQREQLDSMLAYVDATDCRWKTLLGYFHETVEWDRCRRCDNCRRSQPLHGGWRAERSEAADNG